MDAGARRRASAPGVLSEAMLGWLARWPFLGVAWAFLKKTPASQPAFMLWPFYKSFKQ